MQNYYNWIIIGMVVLCPLLHFFMHRKHNEPPEHSEHDSKKTYSKDTHSCCR